VNLIVENIKIADISIILERSQKCVFKTGEFQAEWTGGGSRTTTQRLIQLRQNDIAKFV
jgi:hypothetical protein